MSASATTSARITVDGKFFRLGAEKFFVKGITYGPFAPNTSGEMFPSPEQTARDFVQLRALGANVIRVYYVPPRWILDLALQHGLRVFVDVPWEKHLCFLDDRTCFESALRCVREAVTACKGHPGVFAFSLVNEIPPDIARWSGAHAVAEFIDDLVDAAKAIDPECLCTFTSFPPTEFLSAENIDFLCFNVYLHHRNAFENYLGRLQTLAGVKPLMLGEFGIDSIREGEPHKCDILAWQIESAFRCGLAGTVVFSYTDDWFRGGQQIEDWAFGLTTRDRQPKQSFAVVQKQFHQAPHFPLPRTPKVSVIVASYNGAKTLATCLDSLSRLHYADYEVILVDDGSTDETPTIAARYPNVRLISQANHGLSIARNTGIAAATGEVIAFTDSDCRADEDWLYYLINDLLSGDFVGIGGHNFLPPEDSPIAATVMVSPGGPAHVMLTDRIAEHIPGCNMAFYRWALDEIGGFDPMFRKAGDDVDVCWRLQERGYKIGFSPAGFVWHYRRSTVKAYLRQQAGYGEAEALLSRKHPEYFNPLGGGIWRGRIYTSAKHSVLIQRPVIYHGVFGSGLFQQLYTPPPAYGLMFLTALEYHGLVTLPLLVLSVSFPRLLPLGLASLALSILVCIAAAAQAELPRKKRRWWSRPLVALLFFLQPIERGRARYRSQLQARERKTPPPHRIGLLQTPEFVSYWSNTGENRYALLTELARKFDGEGWHAKLDSGWNDYDVEVLGRWSRVRLVTVTEELAHGKTTIRCRFRNSWSLLGKILFGVVMALELLVVGLIGKDLPWLWMLLLTLPIVAWALDYEARRFHYDIIELVNSAARHRGWVTLEAKRFSEKDAALVVSAKD